MKHKNEGILVLADPEYITIPPAGRGRQTDICGLKVRYVRAGAIRNRSLSLNLYDKKTLRSLDLDPDLKVMAVVDALRSTDSFSCHKDLLLTHIPVLIVVATTTHLYDEVYTQAHKDALGDECDERLLKPGRPANILRLIPSNAAQAWSIASWLRHDLEDEAHVGIILAEHHARQDAARQQESGNNEEQGEGKDNSEDEFGPDRLYVADLLARLQEALQAHKFKVVTGRQRGDSLMLSWHGRLPGKLDAAVCASYPPEKPRRFLEVLENCTDRIILPDAWEPVRMAPPSSADVYNVLVARSPVARLEDALESIDKAVAKQQDRKDAIREEGNAAKGRDRLTRTTEGRTGRSRPRDSLILQIHYELEALHPPAYRFEKGWQNTAFGYEVRRWGQ